MSSSPDFERYDLPRIIAAALYLGMFLNILMPAGLLLLCYLIHEKGGVSNLVGSFGNGLFYILAGLSVVQAVGSLYWRHKSLAQPMARSLESMQDDLREQMVKRLKPIFVVIALIAGYGVMYYLLTDRFEEGLFFVVFSFLVFQVVRPRYSSLKKLIVHQEALVKQGQKLAE